MNKPMLIASITIILFSFTSISFSEEDPHAVNAGQSPYSFKAGEGPLNLPSNADESIQVHNKQGIELYLKQNFEEALNHFKEGLVIKPASGVLLYNEALVLDRLDRHKEATMRFQQAKDHANGNQLIEESPILQAHINR